MKVLWIGGWAIASSTIEAIVSKVLPKLNHLCIHPHEGYLESIDNYNPDILIGYSLGATLLLDTSFTSLEQYLIAPFLNIEGATQVNNTQLKYLLKWLKNDPIRAINDFYKRSQLCLPELKELPYPLHDLIWGIEALIKTKTITIDFSKQIFLGNRDPLINQNFFLKYGPNSVVCGDADHNLKGYLKLLPFQQYAVQ